MSKRPSVWGTLPDSGAVLTTAESLRTAESVRVQELRYAGAAPCGNRRRRPTRPRC